MWFIFEMRKHLLNNRQHVKNQFRCDGHTFVLIFVFVKCIIQTYPIGEGMAYQKFVSAKKDQIEWNSVGTLFGAVT